MANLRIAELDFDEIKSNLKTYLQAQTEFTDYDFEGAGLSVLLDILAYNTHYNAYLANMVMNEMFLDSAVKRSSAVSLAKHLGYTPRSARGAQATIDVIVTGVPGSPTSLSLPVYTPFTTTINGQAFTFVNLEEKIASPIDGTYTFENVVITQGQPFNYRYTVATPGPSERYEIPNNLVDTRSLTVTVQTSSTDLTSEKYTLATDITGIDGTSKVFFLQENAQEKYEIYFGDDVIGKKLSAGNIVIIEYIITDGVAANTSANITQSFTTSSTIGGSSAITTTTVSNSVGGSDKESITSIKFNAPLVNAAKNRAVTAKDYEALILSQFSEAEAVSVWGGEDNDPPYYGKVLISLKPYSGFFISQATKDNVAAEILANKKVLAIQPEFIDPEYYFVKIEASVKYNPNLTTNTSEQIIALVRTKIEDYFDAELSQFNKNFYASHLSNLLFDVDPAVLSANLEIALQKRIIPSLSTANRYADDTAVKFNNALHPSEVISSNFYTTVAGTSTLVNFRDTPDTSPPDYSGTGTLKLYNASTGAVINANYGTVNYATGTVTIPELLITGFTTGVNSIYLTGYLQEISYDISALRNQILVLDESALNPTAGITPGLTISVSAVTE